MRFFIEKEFVCKCCGQLPPFAKENVEALVDNVLDPAREKFGGPIIVNSGYRCPKHNKAVGGVTGSQHLLGQAADVRFQGSGFRVQDLAKAIKENGKFDQLILYPTFVHVSWKRVGQNRREVLEKTANGYRRAAL